MRDAWATIGLSRDGAHNEIARTEHYLGDVGAFMVPVLRTRCGQARQMVLIIEVSSQIKRDLIDGQIQIQQEQ
jgi:hypothetical protein